MKISIREIKQLVREALSGCQKCRGTGQIDMGFYTRDCMDCRSSDGVELFDDTAESSNTPATMNDVESSYIISLISSYVAGEVSQHNFVERLRSVIGDEPDVDYVATLINIMTNPITTHDDYKISVDEIDNELMKYINKSIADIIPWDVS